MPSDFGKEQLIYITPKRKEVDTKKQHKKELRGVHTDALQAGVQGRGRSNITDQIALLSCTMSGFYFIGHKGEKE